MKRLAVFPWFFATFDVANVRNWVIPRSLAEFLCQWLDGLPAEETVRKAVYASLPDYAELQRRLNRALAGRLPGALRRRRQRLAIDLTLIPYHGAPFRDPKE